MNKITIVLLNPSDWSVYKTIQLEALKEDPAAFGASYKEWSSFSDQKWQERPNNPDSRIFIAKDSDKPIGLLGVYFHIVENEEVADIWGMYVNQGYRKKGIAKMLLSHAFDSIRQKGLKKAQLMVEYNPTPAQHLYKSVGFQPIKTLDYVLGDGKKHQLYEMEKILS